MALEQLIQAVVPAPDPTAMTLVWGIMATFSAAVVAVLTWVTRTTLAVSRNMDRLLVAMFGYNGDNGLNGDVKACKLALEKHIKDYHSIQGRRSTDS